MKPVLACAVSLAILAFGCDRSEPTPVRDPRDHFELTLLDDAAVTSRGDKAKWVLEDPPIAVSLQSISTSEPTPIERTLSSVHRALSLRLERELGATVQTRSCRVAGRTASCFEARHRSPQKSATVQRKSFLVTVGDEMVLVECAGPEEHAEAIDRQAELLRASFRPVGDAT